MSRYVAEGRFIGKDQSLMAATYRYLLAYQMFRLSFSMCRYVAEGRFIGKDQSLMAATCLETTLCLLLDGTSTAWFRKGEWPPFWFGLVWVLVEGEGGISLI